MSVHAGSILTVGGNSVIDRLQSAGLGDPNVPTEVIREVGNKLIVDKVPGEPEFTFSMESLDVSPDLLAMILGKQGTIDEAAGTETGPSAADAAATEYKWSAAAERCFNIASPWKSPAGDPPAGIINAGHLVPCFYPTRLQYRYGVTDNAQQTLELGGGAFYYAGGAPVEEFVAGIAAQVAYITSENAIAHRKGGAGGTTFRHIFGVIVNGKIMVEGVDYTVAGGAAASPWAPVTITFAVAPGAGADIRFCYFTDEAHEYKQGVHASTIVKPGAVRGRNIVPFLGAGGSRQRIAGSQSFELDATVDGAIEREMGTEEPIGRQVNGTDVSGTLTVRARDNATFLALLSKVTGVAVTEVIGYLNQNPIPLEVAIQNPKDPGTILKTVYVPDAIFQVPSTPARVNAPTDFALRFQGQSGDFSEFKGAKP